MWSTPAAPHSPVLLEDSTTTVAAFVSLWPGKPRPHSPSGGAPPAAHTLGFLSSREPNRTQVLSFFQTDLGGLLPRSVVDSFFPSSMMDFYGNLTKAALAL